MCVGLFKSNLIYPNQIHVSVLEQFIRIRIKPQYSSDFLDNCIQTLLLFVDIVGELKFRKIQRNIRNIGAK